MRILKATHLGMCFGVRDAIKLVQSQTEPVTVLGDLVHNERVLQQLRRQGVQIKHRAAQVATSTVMITAHGTSDRTRDQLARQGLRVLEATCPLVHYAHEAARQLVRDGFHLVIIGQRDHVEVRGLTGDFDRFDVVLSEEEVDRLPAYSRFGVAAQTTQPIDRVRRLVDYLKDRFPESEVRFIDTVCQPTKQRQSAAVELSRRCDVVLVIGGAHSNNTRELVATCARHCARVHHVRSAADVDESWLANAECVGITAGTSTPDPLIDEIEAHLLLLAHGLEQRRGAWRSGRAESTVLSHGSVVHD